MLNNLSKKLEYLEIEQHQFREWVRQSNEFSEVEKSTILYDTLTEFENHSTKGNEAKCQFDSCHDRDHGLRSKRHQSLSSVVQSFMDYFSPLVQIIKDLGAPYGGIAIATISVLVTVSFQPRNNQIMTDSRPGCKQQRKDRGQPCGNHIRHKR